MVQSYGPVGAIAMQHTRNFQKAVPLPPVSPPGLQSGSDDFISPKALLESEGEFMAPEELAELEKCHKVYYYGQFARCGSKIFDPPLFPNSRTGIFPFRMFAHMNFRYEIISGLGEGSFGHVVKAYDHKTKTFCAVKIVRSDPTILAQAEEERKILRHLNKVSQKHHNVVQLLDSFQFYGHLCFVFELQGDSLYDVLKKRNFKGLSLTAVRRIAHDVLKCLLLLSQENIVHTDLKPENILINNHTRNKNQLLDCSLATLRTMTRFDVASPLPAITSQEVYNATVIDFGCSDFVGKTDNTYVQSRYYRAPEVILGLKYGLGIDMWSLGCILAEMYSGVPIFPGEDEIDQLYSIMEVLGHVPHNHIDASRYKQTYVDDQGRVNTRLHYGKNRRPRAVGVKTLKNMLFGADTQFIDFVERCLQYSDTRWTAEHALRHPWLQEELSKSGRRSSGPQRPTRPIRRRPSGPYIQPNTSNAHDVTISVQTTGIDSYAHTIDHDYLCTYDNSSSTGLKQIILKGPETAPLSVVCADGRQ